MLIIKKITYNVSKVNHDLHKIKRIILNHHQKDAADIKTLSSENQNQNINISINIYI